MEAGATVTYSTIASGVLPPVEYSLNGGEWISYSSEITLANIGDKVSFRGNNATYTNSNYKYARFSCTADCYIYGNIMSLVNATGYATATTLSSERTFMNMFNGNTHIKNHPTNELVLPATTLTAYCYCGMFRGCTGLTSVPALPATTLVNDCYYNMFRDCTGLTAAPALPATTLTERCYREMFYGCTGLTTLPENMLPATTLANNCYQNMFQNCSSLTSAPALPATTLTELCYYGMFYGCTGLTTLPENMLPATTLAEYCYEYMFNGCTGLTSAPALPATTLANSCYYSMFKGCTGLTTLPENMLPATTLAEYCYYGMFYGCTGLTTLPENMLPATTLAKYCYYDMFYGCTGLTSAPVLPATTLVTQCYYSMFRGCTGLTTLPENMLPATTLAERCYREMFMGCTGLTSAPALPATTLASNCYYYMFNGCTNLSSVTCYATARQSNSTNNWLTGVAASGTFYAPIDNVFAGQAQNPSNIPSGWTLKNIVPAKEDPQNAGVYYSTLYHSTQRYALQDDGTEAYVGSLSNDALILTKIAEADQVLPENTAVIIKSATPNIIIEPTNAAGVTFSAVNNLQGVDAATSAPANCYVLSGQSSNHSVSGVGFYQFSGTLGAHKAYLTIPSGSPAPKRISFAYGTTTDIEATADAATQGAKKMLRNGQLVILLDGVEYNAQGQIIR